MHPFDYQQPKDASGAVSAVAPRADAKFLAGGTTLIDLIKLNVEMPAHLVDVTSLPLAQISDLPGGGVRIGALVKNSDLAHDARIQKNYPVLSQALLSGASPQLRNMATTAGNLMQRTRCYYFRDTATPCNKREPGSGCSAIDGYNRIHTILDTSNKCIASHPSDMCVAMTALDAQIRVQEPKGERIIPITEFYVPYGEDPAKETVLAHGELITAVDLPLLPFAAQSHYLKVRDRASYAFALTSAAVALDVQGGKIAQPVSRWAGSAQSRGVLPRLKKPWSSKSLRACYQTGAERFGWAKRNPVPRSMKTEDGKLIGWGMATATYPVRRSASSALARILPDGTAYVQAGTQDLGTGTYTVMTQTAADALGLPPSKVRFELGDTQMPETPVSGGSQTAASTGSAVLQAGQATRSQAIQVAIADTASPLHGLTEADVDVQEGRLVSKTDPTKGETYANLLTRQKLPMIEAKTKSAPGEEKDKYAMHSFGAIFAEVQVDPDFGEVRVTRLVGAYGVGNILNAKTARSQLIGGVIFGLGMALLEQTVADTRTGRVVNPDLAEYHIPVNADVPDIDITFVEEHDPYVNPLGVKGIGEIGITGVCAALANAVYHATGKRVRDLPITLDKVM